MDNISFQPGAFKKGANGAKGANEESFVFEDDSEERAVIQSEGG
jgi:hypothetical protein